LRSLKKGSDFRIGDFAKPIDTPQEVFGSPAPLQKTKPFSQVVSVPFAVDAAMPLSADRSA